MELAQQLLVNSLISGSQYALLGLGFTLTFGAVRFFNFAHGGFAIIAAYIAFALIKKAGLDPLLSMLIAVLGTGLFGVFLEAVLYAPLRKKKSKTLVIMVASIGVLTMIQAIMSLIFKNQYQTLADPQNPARVFIVGAASITEYQIWSIVAALVATLLLALFISYTRSGKAIKAVSDDEEVARIMGINTNRITMLIFFLSAMIAAVAGLVRGFDIGFDPALGIHLFLKGVIAAIIGSLGSIPGALVGGMILGAAENFGVWKIATEWKDAIAFSLLIIFLIFRPQGLFKK